MLERIHDDSEFWYTVGLIYEQFLGLRMGYNSVAPKYQVSNYVQHGQQTIPSLYVKGESLCIHGINWFVLFWLQQLDEFAFDLLNGMGDFLDISNFLFKDRRPDISTLTIQQLQSMVLI